jgi:A-factor biosynthesis hotdog domain
MAYATIDLSHERTVARGLVHLRGLSEVFIADVAQTSEDEFHASCQLPRSHCLWGDRSHCYHDPVVTLEVGRQTVFFVLHHFHAIPTDWKFVLKRIDFQLADLEAYRDNRVTPPEGVARVRQLEVRREHGLLEASFEGEVVIEGTRGMTMTAEIAAMSPFNYKMLRAQGRGRKPLEDAQPPPAGAGLPAQCVGRRDQRNVVIYRDSPQGAAAGCSRYELLVDQEHPAFFDHPHDHVTGSLILEFFRQSAIVAASEAGLLAADRAVVSGCSMSFEEFAELDILTTCHATAVGTAREGDVVIDLELEQVGATIADAQLRVLEVRADTDEQTGAAPQSG